MRIGDKLTYPTYKDIHDFLEYRIRALESIAPPATKRFTKITGDANSIRPHLSTSPKVCDCDEIHPLYKCEQFKTKPVNARQKFVRDQSLCNNCLSPAHATKQCPSKYTCYHCRSRHHSILHHPNYQKKSKNEKLSYPPGGGNSIMSTPAAALNPQPSTSGAHVSQSSSQHVVADQIDNLHACKPKLSPATVMLATAWVLVSSPNGRTVRVRTLLDQGSQSSFVTESIVQTLRAPRIKARVPVSGIGGTDAGIGRAVVQLTLKSCIGSNDEVQCTAIAFSKLIFYVPQ